MAVKSNKLGNLERLGGSNLTKIKFTRAINRYVEHLNGAKNFKIYLKIHLLHI